MVVGLFQLVVTTRTWDERSLTVAESLAYATAGALAVVACAGRARRAVPNGEGWRWLALACAFYAVAQVGYAVEAVVRRPLPEAGEWVSNVPALFTVPLAIVALTRLAGPISMTRKVTAVLDALAVAIAWLIVSWTLVLAPAYRQTQASSQASTTVLYFLGGALLLAGLAIVLAVRWAGDARTIVLLTTGIFWLSTTQLIYSIKTIDGSYVAGDAWVDVGWLGAFLLLALAAAGPDAGCRERSDRRRSLMAIAVPCAALLVALSAYGGLRVRGDELDIFVEVTGILLVLVLLVRFLIALNDNHVLTRDLERRVEERTAAARLSDSRLQALLRSSSDVIAVLDDRDRFGYLSPAANQVLEQDPERLRGTCLLTLVHPQDRSLVQACLDELREQDGEPRTLAFRLSLPEERWVHVEATVAMPREDPQIGGPVLNIRDVSDRRALEEELRLQATYDPLTALGNRRLLHERVRHALDRARRTGVPLSVLYVDLDHFKRINDTAGHAVGDQVLVLVADRLRRCLRPSDTAVRLGGDEFAVLLEDTNEEQARDVAARVLAALEPPYELPDRALSVSASVGLTTTREGDDGDALLRDADVAMYHAKAHGRARLAVFVQEMRTDLVRQMELEVGLREAMDRQQLRLQYQPVVDLRTGAVTGVEALLRWRADEDNEIPPSLFIPLAEELGLIQQLDAWALRAACRQVRHWQGRFPQHRDLQVSVNLSPLDLREPGLAERVEDILRATDLPAAALVLEITETAVLPEGPLARAVLHELRDLGVGIALDDFGTGYGSLAALQDLPLDQIKIDRTFVAGMDNGSSGRRLVSAILDMAHALGLSSVAEAVETPYQLALLRQMGCGAGQGRLFAAPQDPTDLTALLSTGSVALPVLLPGARRPPAEHRVAGGAAR